MSQQIVSVVVRADNETRQPICAASYVGDTDVHPLELLIPVEWNGSRLTVKVRVEP